MSLPLSPRARLWCLTLSLSAATGILGCSTTSVYKGAAKIGVQLVGDSIAEDKVQAEYRQMTGRNAADADQRYGQPRGVFREVNGGRQVRVYNVEGDLLGKKRWVVELSNNRIDSLSQVEENPDLVKDKARALMLTEALRGKTPQEVQNTPVMDKLIFKSRPRELRKVPTGELVQIYDVTSFLDIAGSRYVVLGFDKAGRCETVRYVGAP